MTLERTSTSTPTGCVIVTVVTNEGGGALDVTDQAQQGGLACNSKVGCLHGNSRLWKLESYSATTGSYRIAIGSHRLFPLRD